MSPTLRLMITAFALASCGGGQSTETTHGQPKNGDDLDVPDKGQDSGSSGTDGASVDAGVEEPAKPEDPVTFVISNSGSEDLVFSTDRGWQPIIFGFSGKPPKAKPIIMFPKFCTASCDVDAAERCPHCPQPEKVKEIREAEKREVVEPGKSLEIPWDAQVFAYERGKGTVDGRTKRCECYRKEPVPAETYTIRVCGLRVTKVAEKRSKLQCVDASMTMPSDEPIRVELDFPDPKGK